MRPQLDVNVVLYSPMFMDSFQVVRRTSGVDESGRTTVVEQTLTVTGVIHEWGNNAQERPKDYAAGQKGITIYTPFRLLQQSDGFLPDLVLYQNDDFLVTGIEDWTRYGRGYVRAYAQSQDLQDEPPQQ